MPKHPGSRHNPGRPALSKLIKNKAASRASGKAKADAINRKANAKAKARKNTSASKPGEAAGQKKAVFKVKVPTPTGKVQTKKKTFTNKDLKKKK